MLPFFLIINILFVGARNTRFFLNLLKIAFPLSGRLVFILSLEFFLSAIPFIFFLGLVEDILAKDPFIEADLRLMNLIVSLRNLSTAKIFLFFTYLGNWQIIASLLIIAAIILVLIREKIIHYL